MALSYGFFDSVDGDRKYNASDLSGFFKGLISDGIFSGVGNHFVVTAPTSGLSVIVGSGRAYLDGKWIDNDGGILVSLDVSTPLTNGQKRKHAIAIVTDTTISARNCRLVSVAGTASVSVDPPTPTLTDTAFIKYHTLAYVLEEYNDDNIETGDITNRIGVSPLEFEASNSATPFVVCPVAGQVVITELTQQWASQWQAFVLSSQTQWTTLVTGCESEWEDLTEGCESEWGEMVTSLTNEITAARTAASQAGVGYFQVGNIQLTNRVVPTSSWVEMTTPTYEYFPYRADLATGETGDPVASLLSTDTPQVYFSYNQIVQKVFCPVAEITAGHLYLYATEIPDPDEVGGSGITIPNIIIIRAMPTGG